METSVKQLRSYIAPAAPATRAPCDGSEGPLRVEYGFTPRWYRARCGVDFSERWHTDALYRASTVLRMRAALHEAFPSLRLGYVDRPSANLDGVHGGVLMARVFGIECEYYPDNWPAARHEYLSKERISAMGPPDLSRCPVIDQLFEQMDVIEQEAGRIGGFLNWQGVLNSAFRIRGPEIFADLMEDAPFAEHLFGIIAEAMIEGMRLVYQRQRATGFVVEHATVSNCVVNMIAPETYAEHLLPFDRRIAEAFPAFGVHNCAWNADAYLPHYATIDKLGYVDMGLETDLGRARELCPQARRAVMYKPTDLANKVLAEISTDLRRIRAELSPCDIVLADIESDTPDERVLDFARRTAEAAGE